MQRAALQECVRAPAFPPVTLTHVVTVATGVLSAVQILDNVPDEIVRSHWATAEEDLM